MKFAHTKKADLATVAVFALIGFFAGFLLILLDPLFLLRIIFTVFGILVILYSVVGLASGLSAMQTRSGRIALVFSVISLIVGLLLIFWHNTVLTVLLGIYMIVYPLIGILAAPDKMAQLRTELPKMILGVVLLLVGPQKSLTLLFDVVGWIIISLTLVYTVLMLLGSRKGKKHLNRTGGRIFVDTTGDGKIDTVYVDTTGDGKVDTATQYREDK